MFPINFAALTVGGVGSSVLAAAKQANRSFAVLSLPFPCGFIAFPPWFHRIFLVLSLPFHRGFTAFPSWFHCFSLQANMAVLGLKTMARCRCFVTAASQEKAGFLL